MRIDRDYTKAFIQGDLSGAVGVYCEQVATGSKLVGAVSITRNQIRTVKETVKSQQCRVIFDFPFSNKNYKNHGTAYIYKHKYVLLLMKKFWFDRKRQKTPPTISGIWVTGKMFGYSDFEIAKYLNKHGYIDDSFK